MGEDIVNCGLGSTSFFKFYKVSLVLNFLFVCSCFKFKQSVICCKFLFRGITGKTKTIFGGFVQLILLGSIIITFFFHAVPLMRKGKHWQDRYFVNFLRQKFSGKLHQEEFLRTLVETILHVLG